MTRALLAMALVLSAPAAADPLKDFGLHYPDRPASCAVLGEKLNGDPVVRNCTPPAGSPAAALEDAKKNYPSAYANKIARDAVKAEADALKRRLHEERVERWTPPAPRKEQGI